MMMEVVGKLMICIASVVLLTMMPIASSNAVAQQADLVIAPYLQLGDQDSSLVICWAYKGSGQFQCEFKQQSSGWKKAELAEQTLYSKPETRFFTSRLTGLMDGAMQYRISKDQKLFFESQTKLYYGSADELRVALLGDLAFDKNQSKHLLGQLCQQNLDFVMLTGDLMQPAGSLSLYLQQFFPAFNSPAKPISNFMSKTLFAACPGDRDISVDRFDPDHDNRNLDAVPGGMAYFSFWKQPLNGPGKKGATNTPVVSGASTSIEEFIRSAGKSYPGAANYSFDKGDTHWLVLDGGAYMNWQDEQWRAWVRNDLQQSKKRWKFVVMHQAGFSSDPNHGEEQRMRYLCDIFEQEGVDLVFSGHSNSYQRTCPLHFALARESITDVENMVGFVYGKFKLDTKFDGRHNCKPDGVIYIVTGGGGAEPADIKIENDPTRWQPYTRKFYCQKNSVSLLSVKGTELSLKQLADDGTCIDSIRIEK